jgi:error-prone DNA polymerase
VPPGHEDEAARAERGGRALLEELDGFTSGLVAIGGAPLLDSRQYGSAACSIAWPDCSGVATSASSCSATCARRGVGQRGVDVDGKAYRIPIIATNGVRFAEPADRPLFDVLTCVHHKTTLDQRAAAGAQCGAVPEVARGDGAALCRSPDALAGTAALRERLEYTMADLGYRFPAYPVPDGETEMSFLRHITDVGARDRFRPPITARRSADRRASST